MAGVNYVVAMHSGILWQSWAAGKSANFLKKIYFTFFLPDIKDFSK